jgi:hypothetical protein
MTTRTPASGSPCGICIADRDPGPPLAEQPPEHGQGVDARDDEGDDPAADRREVVAGRVVDPAVLDDDRARLFELLQDHALPDQEARERDDERRDADESDDRALSNADHGTDRDRGDHGEQPVDLMAAAGQLELRNGQGADPGHVADREVDLAE